MTEYEFGQAITRNFHASKSTPEIRKAWREVLNHWVAEGRLPADFVYLSQVPPNMYEEYLAMHRLVYT